MPNLHTVEYLLHLYWSPVVHPDAWLGNPDNREAHKRAIQWLLDEGLIEQVRAYRADAREHSFEVTSRGIAYVEYVRDLPLPVSETRWVMPATGSEA